MLQTRYSSKEQSSLGRKVDMWVIGKIEGVHGREGKTLIKWIEKIDL